MKDKNVFINSDWLGNIYHDLDFYVKRYKEIDEEINKLKIEKEKYDKLLDSDDMDDKELTFKEKYALYKMIKNTIATDPLNGYGDVDLHKLKVKFEGLFDDLEEYLSITDNINSLNERKMNITKNEITFDFDKYSSEYCFEGHTFVIDDKELKCVYCGASTKDYDLTDDEFEFLVLCAKHQGLLIEEFTKEDWPLLKVIVEKQKRRKQLKEELDLEDEELMDKLEREYYDDLSKPAEIRFILKKAHKLDDKIYEESVFDRKPNYLSDTKVKELLATLTLELEKIEKSDSKFKPLLIEQCNTAKYEILILSGKHIPTLLEEAISEDDKIALTKAYYNLSDTDYRVDSGYFKNILDNNDAIFYSCYTANPEINNRILEMRVRTR